jgi:hypothetical protein
MRLARGIGAALALALAVPPQASAAISTKMAFTARLADAGTPVTGAHTFVFRFFDAASGGAKLWEETQTGLAVNAGVVNATLGAVSPIPAGVFNGAPLYLEIVYDATALSPRLDVLAVAYALRADTADNALQCVNAASAATATNASHAATADAATTAASATTASSVPWGGVTGVPWTPAGGDAGVAASLARGDHAHDARYYTEAEIDQKLLDAGGVILANVYTKTQLQTSGQAQVSWGNVTSKPTLTCSPVTASADIAGLTMSGIVAACCPAGTVVTGGGFNGHGYAVWSVQISHVWGSCWNVAAYNGYTATLSLEAFAVCCTL